MTARQIKDVLTEQGTIVLITIWNFPFRHFSTRGLVPSTRRIDAPPTNYSLSMAHIFGGDNMTALFFLSHLGVVPHFPHRIIFSLAHHTVVQESFILPRRTGSQSSKHPLALFHSSSPAWPLATCVQDYFIRRAYILLSQPSLPRKTT